jgi:hypothetical protein
MSAVASLPKPAHAQLPPLPTNLGTFGTTVLTGLLNVSAPITVLNGLVVVVDVDDVAVLNNSLNNNDVEILKNFLNDLSITIDDSFNDLLRGADIIKNNQVVVGILTGGAFPVIFTSKR